jgi:membrane protease YdiL (CAAX protease family)
LKGANMIDRKSLLWFLAISFSLSWILFLVPLFFGEAGSTTRQLITTSSWAVAMWGPGLAAILVTRFVRKEPLRTLNLNRLGDKRTYLWAWLLPFGLAIAAGLLTWAFGLGELDLEFTAIREAMQAAPGGAAVPPAVVVLAQIGIALTFAPLFNTLFALGEELGWRGFLLPQLLPLGQWKAILISGVIWGIWHAPAVLQGLNYPGQPVLGVFFMIIFTVLLSAVFSWLYLRTGSPWAPALGHGALNAIAGLPILFLSGVNITYAGTIASPVGWVPLALFVGWLAWTKRLPVAAPPEWIPGNETHSID